MTDLDALTQLAAWARKGYRYTVASGGGFAEGDGVWCELRGGGRVVRVEDRELDRVGDDGTTAYWAGIADVIREALRRWETTGA